MSDTPNSWSLVNTDVPTLMTTRFTFLEISSRRNRLSSFFSWGLMLAPIFDTEATWRAFASAVSEGILRRPTLALHPCKASRHGSQERTCELLR